MKRVSCFILVLVLLAFHCAAGMTESVTPFIRKSITAPNGKVIQFVIEKDAIGRVSDEDLMEFAEDYQDEDVLITISDTQYADDAEQAVRFPIFFWNKQSGAAIELGMNRADVEAVIGPKTGEGNFGDAHGDMTVRFRDDRLVYISSESDQWVDSMDIGVGMPVEVLIETYELEATEGALNYTLAYYDGFADRKQLVPAADVDTSYSYALDFAINDGYVKSIMAGDRDALLYMK